MNFILSDFNNHHNFLPLTYTRSVSEIRCGILTSLERWSLWLKSKMSILTETYLQERYFLQISDNNTIINPNVLPDTPLIEAIFRLNNSKLVYKGEIIAYNGSSQDLSLVPEKEEIYTDSELYFIRTLTDIFSLNHFFLLSDFSLITAGRQSNDISKTNIVFGKYPIFVEENCFIECSSINTNAGPVYIGSNSTIMEGSRIRGSFALCSNSELKMDSKIYGSTTIGPYCKVGGEVNNSIFFARSNKAHDGFIGNSIIGEWCNLGADTNTSNLKNDYSDVKLWNFKNNKFSSTGLQFCGLIMGDHSKSGINTMFNTGTIVGVSANVFGAGYPRNYIPSYAWGGAQGFSEYKIQKALSVMTRVMARRNSILSESDKNMYMHIYNETLVDRNF